MTDRGHCVYFLNGLATIARHSPCQHCYAHSSFTGPVVDCFSRVKIESLLLVVCSHTKPVIIQVISSHSEVLGSRRHFSSHFEFAFAWRDSVMAKRRHSKGHLPPCSL